MSQAEDGENGRGGARRWRRAAPLAVLAVGLAVAFAVGLPDVLSFEALQTHRATLREFVAAQGTLAALAFVAAYALAVALSLPGGAVLTLAGGFLFGAWLGTAYAVVAATLGATALFVAARTALAGALRARAGDWAERLRRGFRDNAFSYLLFLRLLPVFPFWLVNLVPAFVGMSLRSYVAATFLGIIPGTAVYASLGSGLGTVFDAGGTPDLGLIFRAEILAPLAALALLSLAPAAYKAWRRRTAKREGAA